MAQKQDVDHYFVNSVSLALNHSSLVVISQDLQVLFSPPLFHFTWHVNSDGHLEFNEHNREIKPPLKHPMRKRTQRVPPQASRHPGKNDSRRRYDLNFIHQVPMFLAQESKKATFFATLENYNLSSLNLLLYLNLNFPPFFKQNFKFFNLILNFPLFLKEQKKIFYFNNNT